jgi:hypothetical protein
MNQPRFDSDDNGGLAFPGFYARDIVRENSPHSLALSLGAESARVLAARSRLASARVVPASTTPAVRVQRGAPSTPVVSMVQATKVPESVPKMPFANPDAIHSLVSETTSAPALNKETAVVQSAKGSTFLAWDLDLRKKMEEAGVLWSPVLAKARTAQAKTLFPELIPKWDIKTPWYKQTAGKIFIGAAAIWTAAVGGALIVGAGGAAAAGGAGATGAAGVTGAAGATTAAVAATALPAAIAPAAITAATTGGGILAAVGGATGIVKGLVTGLSIYSGVQKVIQAKETAKAAQTAAANAGKTAGLQDAYSQYVQAAKNAGYNPVPYSTFSSWAAGGGSGTPPVGEPLAAGEAGLQSSFLPLLLLGAVGVVLLTRGK